MNITFLIVFILAVLITLDIIVDVYLIQAMGYSLSDLLRASWGRFKSRWGRRKADDIWDGGELGREDDEWTRD